MLKCSTKAPSSLSKQWTNPGGLGKSDFLDTPHGCGCHRSHDPPHDFTPIFVAINTPASVVFCILHSAFLCITTNHHPPTSVVLKCITTHHQPLWPSSVSQHITDLCGHQVNQNTFLPGHYYWRPRPNTKQKPLRVEFSCGKIKRHHENSVSPVMTTSYLREKFWTILSESRNPSLFSMM